MSNQEMRDEEKDEEMRKNVLTSIREKVVGSVTPWGPYFYRDFNITEPPDWRFHPALIPESGQLEMLANFRKSCNNYESFDFSIEPMVLGGAKLCSYSELLNITDFAPDKLIQQTHLGRLFRGTVGEGFKARQVIVKTWDFHHYWKPYYAELPSKFCDEIEMLTNKDVNTHPNLAKLCMFCLDTRLAAVYEENFVGVLSDVLLDDNFEWADRLKVVADLANLLACLHENGIAVGSITASSIMLNEEWNIKVFDFGWVSNHVNEGSKIHVEYFIGRDYFDTADKRSTRSDVIVFGFLLVELITKKTFNWKFLGEARLDKKQLVNEYFSVDDETLSDITKLALDCTKSKAVDRPTMRTVYTKLSDMTIKRGEKRRRDESEAE